ncbi:hypothetical protein D3C73_742790 [compost metagenome]
MGVHVAHQYLVFVVANQIADIGQLQAARPGAQCQVHHDDHQCFRAFAEPYQNGSAPLWARQRMIFNGPRAQSAEHAIAVLGQAT